MNQALELQINHSTDVIAGLLKSLFERVEKLEHIISNRVDDSLADLVKKLEIPNDEHIEEMITNFDLTANNDFESDVENVVERWMDRNGSDSDEDKIREVVRDMIRNGDVTVNIDTL